MKLAVLFTGIFLFGGLFSCNDNCGPFANKYRVVGLEWNVLRANFVESSVTLEELETDTVDYYQFAIDIRPKTETYFAFDQSQKHGAILASACACSPVPPTTNQRIDSLVILTDKPFNANHKVGTNLADLFDVLVTDDANAIYQETYDLNTYIATRPMIPRQLALLLKQEPEESEAFQFKVLIYQSDLDKKDVFDFTTQNVFIKRVW